MVPDLSPEPVGANSFAYKELCLETMDYAWTEGHPRRLDSGYPLCRTKTRRILDAQRDQTMRAAIPLDFNFPRLELRDEAAGPGRSYAPDTRGYDSEVYHPAYFSCDPFLPGPRDCFQPIYGLECLETNEIQYGDPVAFWSSVYADRVADAPGAIAARSAVMGFPPVYFKPDQAKGAVEAIIFNEWQLPKK